MHQIYSVQINCFPFYTRSFLFPTTISSSSDHCHYNVKDINSSYFPASFLVHFTSIQILYQFNPRSLTGSCYCQFSFLSVSSKILLRSIPVSIPRSILDLCQCPPRSFENLSLTVTNNLCVDNSAHLGILLVIYDDNNCGFLGALFGYFQTGSVTACTKSVNGTARSRLCCG